MQNEFATERKMMTRANRVKFLMECHSTFRRREMPAIGTTTYMEKPLTPIQEKWLTIDEAWEDDEEDENEYGFRPLTPEERERIADENADTEFWRDYERMERAEKELPIFDDESGGPSLHQLKVFIEACERGEPIHSDGDTGKRRASRK